jgi:hypothetical protein
MTVINVNSISGINSITAQSGALNFYTATGNNLPITAATLNVGTGASISSPATNVLTLGTNNSERVRVDSSGNVGIGTTNPSTIFHIRQPADYNGITISHATRIGKWRLEHSGTNSENFVFIQNNGTSDANTYVMGRDVHYWYTNNVERMSLTSSGNLGIGTAPTEKTHVYSSGDVKLLVETPSSGVNANSALYLKTASEGNWLLQTGNAVSGGLRVYDAAASLERARMDTSGRLTLPYQPSGAWALTVNASAVRSVSIKKNIGNNISSVPGGNGSTHGSVGRFTAPVNGAYLISLLSTAVGSSSQCLMSVYGSWTSATNTVAANAEVFDCRNTRPPEDGGGWSQVFYFNANDYWEIDWYRPVPTAYIDASMTMNVTVHLLG